MIKQEIQLEDYIRPLDMNGMSGRVLHVPAPAGKTAELLFVYSQLSSLERWFGMFRYLHQFGSVTAPDLPGIGGMDSFYTIGRKPTLDAFADYLAAVVKMRYRRKKVVIIGVSFGFVVATRMLQRYPELSKHVTMVISLGGFMHTDEFTFTKRQKRKYARIGRLCSYRLPAWLLRSTPLRPPVLHDLYARTPSQRRADTDTAEAEAIARVAAMEVSLWRQNNVRTRAVILGELLALNNCNHQIEVPLWHVSLAGDRYLDRHRVEQHLQIAFQNTHVATAHFKSPAPSLLPDEAEIDQLIPHKLRRALGKL